MKANSLYLLISIFGIVSAPSLLKAQTSRVHWELRTLEAFQIFLKRETFSVSELVSYFGPPDKEVGSGIHILSYSLTNGSTVLIGTPDMKSALYVTYLKADGTSVKLYPEKQ
jgi:hypothetical protein